MAKYRHRVFEMYEFRDEATVALTPKSALQDAGSSTEESWTSQYLAVSQSAGVTHVQFQSTRDFGEETANELRADFSQLADRLATASAVLVDFSGVESFGVAAIEELILFNQKLRTRGSRIALCCLDTAVHESFFRKTQRT